VGCGVAGALLFAFVLTVALVVYISVTSTEQAKNPEAAVNLPAEREEPSRSVGEREPNRETPDRPATPNAEAPRAEAPPTEGLSKTLASMDRLTIAIAPPQEDDTPTPEVWTGHTASIRGVAYTHDGRFVVSVSGAIQKDGKDEDNSIRIWDARRGKPVRKLDGFREALDAVSVSSGGRFAVFGHGGHWEGDKWIDSVDHRVHLWDIQDNKEFYIRKGVGDADKSETSFQGLDSSVFSTAFSPDRSKVVGVANSGKTVVWEAQSGTTLVSEKVVAVPRLRTDGNSLRPTRFTLSGINCIRFTADGRWLLAAGGDYTVRLLDATTGQEVHNFESHQDIVWAVATVRTKDGRLLGLSGGGSRMRLQGGGFVAGARDYAIRLWDLNTRREIRRFAGHEKDVLTLFFCPNGRHFLSAGQDETVRLWDIASGKLLRTYRGHTAPIRSVSVAPDGRAAVSGGDDCKLRFWRLPATVQDVMLALDKKSHTDLTAAMSDLDTMGPELRIAYPKLVQTLGQSDKEMGELALTLLRRLGTPDKEWVSGLRELLAGPLPAARLFAAEALARLGVDALPALAELRKALSDTDPAVRRSALTALSSFGKDAREAADDLGRLMERETESAIKTEIVQTLGKIDGAAALKKLFRDVNEPALLVAIMDALAAAGLDRSMVDPLTDKGLRHVDAAVRSKALDSLRQIDLDTLRIKTLVELKLGDAVPEVRDRAAKVLGERMSHLSDADMKDVRALLAMTDKPQAVQIGLEAVRRLGPKAREALPELAQHLSAAEGKHKLEMALALAAIDAKDEKIAEAVSPILIAALRPDTKNDKPNEAVLKAIAAVGQPAVREIFKALAAADDRGVINANNRKALFLALQRLGREAYSEANVQLLRDYQKKERYRDVQEAAGKAIYAMLPR